MTFWALRKDKGFHGYRALVGPDTIIQGLFQMSLPRPYQGGMRWTSQEK